MRRSFRLDAIVTVVDAKHVSSHLDPDDESVKQVAFADVILLNKTDLVVAGASSTRSRRASAASTPWPRSTGPATATSPLDRVLDVGGFNLEPGHGDRPEVPGARVPLRMGRRLPPARGNP